MADAKKPVYGPQPRPSSVYMSGTEVAPQTDGVGVVAALGGLPDLVIAFSSAAGTPLEQIAEMWGGRLPPDLAVFVDGAVGLESHAHILELAKHARVTWRLPAASVERASPQLTLNPNVQLVAE